MIGDWANLSEDDVYRIPCKVVELHTDELLVIQPQDAACDVVGYDMIRPIPLTEEILEKNGFHYFPSATPYYYLESVDVLLNKEQGRCGYYTSILNHRIFINYVHELQHALRLCGITYLADNFKI